MSNLSNEEALLEAVAGCPGATAGEIAHHLGMDRSNARRDLKKLWRDGKVTGRDDGGTLRFSANGQAPQPEQRPYCADPANSQHVIDGEFRVLTQSNGWRALSSDSRALVVHGAAQPADSRMAGAVAAKTRRGRSETPLPAQDMALLNALFVADPDGAEAIAALQQSIDQRLRAQTAHEAWVREEYARQRQEQEEAAARAKEKARADELHEVIQRMLGSRSSREDDDDREPSLIELRQQRRLEGELENERRYQEALERQDRLRAEMWAEEPDEQRAPLRTANHPTKPRKSVTELLNQPKPSEPPATKKWQQFALAGVGVVAFMCVVKFAEGLTAV